MARRAAISKKDSPSYTQLCGYVPKDVAKQFKLLCMELDLNQSEGVEKALRAWLASCNARVDTGATEISYDNIGSLVRANIKELENSPIKPHNLEAIASGEKPSPTDLVQIGAILHVNSNDLVALYKKSFPECNNGSPQNSQ